MVAYATNVTTLTSVEQLRALVQEFARGFGFLRSAQTPCGKSLALSHAHALMILLSRRHEVTLQRDLSVLLGIDKSNVARLCRKMEQVGHITQRPSPNDARARVLQLTPRGAKVAAEVEASSRDRFDKLNRALPRAQRTAVVRALRTLVRATRSL